MSETESFGPQREQAPAPLGIHRALDEDVYHRMNAMSQSALKIFKRSPAHMQAALANPTGSSAAQVLGTAIHAGILEPDKWERRYYARPAGDGRNKEVKAARELAEANHPGGIALDEDGYSAVLGIGAAVRACVAGDLLADAADIEVSAVWDHPEHPHCRCKLRTDVISSPALNVIIDIKSTEDASPRQFERSIFQYGYYNQAAWYLDAWEYLGYRADAFVIVAVEKKPPYGVGVFRLRGSAVDAGREENARLMSRYARCLAENYWPCYADELVDVGLPPWAYKIIEGVE